MQVPREVVCYCVCTVKATNQILSLSIHAFGPVLISAYPRLIYNIGSGVIHLRRSTMSTGSGPVLCST